MDVQPHNLGQDCDSNAEVDEHSVAMPAGLVIPREIPKELTEAQAQREAMKDELGKDSWMHPDNPAIWDGMGDEGAGSGDGPFIGVIPQE